MTEPCFHDDGLCDGIALVTAVREDRTADIAVLLRHCNAYEVALTLAKLVAEAADESGATPEHLRTWGTAAARRS